jgi:hypothetical protein
MTDEFPDGQPRSSVLVYFSGILDISPDGGHFQCARLFIPHLSALIYLQRLLFLEHALTYCSYYHIQKDARPHKGYFACLHAVRIQYMVTSSLTALGEFQRLPKFGRQQTRLDLPAFLLYWSDHGQTVSIENFSVTMDAFRDLPAYFLRQATSLCVALILNLDPTIDLCHVPHFT